MKKSTVGRGSKNKKERKRILIVGEGTSEQNYFIHRRREFSEELTIEVKNAKGGSLQQVISHAANLKRTGEYDEVLVVLDCVVSMPSEEFKKGEVYASENNLKLYFSNPCFEVWYLLHFTQNPPIKQDCNGVIQELKPKWLETTGREYDKGDDNAFKKLADMQETARANAEKILNRFESNQSARERCCSTEAHLVLKRLDDLRGKEDVDA